tara:strand:+ start:137 stop:577 length:441 start_codon:yes stop_codon:yes gene_type:complete
VEKFKKMNLKQSVNLLSSLVTNKNLAQDYAINENKNLRRLSAKKDTALGCLLAGIERVDSIDPGIKASWFNWLFYAMEMIKDDEVDALAESLALGLEEYKMAYFSSEFIESLPEEKKSAAEALLKPYVNRIKGTSQMAESLKSWKI